MKIMSPEAFLSVIELYINITRSSYCRQTWETYLSFAENSEDKETFSTDTLVHCIKLLCQISVQSGYQVLYGPVTLICYLSMIWIIKGMKHFGFQLKLYIQRILVRFMRHLHVNFNSQRISQLKFNNFKSRIQICMKKLKTMSKFSRSAHSLTSSTCYFNSKFNLFPNSNIQIYKSDFKQLIRLYYIDNYPPNPDSLTTV
ncbi:Hypothetical_protein [Hexamita inflata]|uniref:Hypothetical_protein n=1 Tax=Hexamita inflata TaxID=28002 RepID=A0AA86PAJ7_9EUKA|nr:Hypothetical protein HINF_LOCUS22573 [Hexamita inflata]